MAEAPQSIVRPYQRDDRPGADAGGGVGDAARDLAFVVAGLKRGKRSPERFPPSRPARGSFDLAVGDS